MIQNNLFKAKMMTADIETVIHCELDDIKSKVERIHELTNKINTLINDMDMKHDVRDWGIMRFNNEIMALTQDLHND